MPSSYFKQRGLEPVNQFGSKFGPALLGFTADFLKSEAVNHALTKGEEREEPIRNFFRDHLPSTYSVVGGEVVDIEERTSPQIDILVYDEMRNTAFYHDGNAILPAEALLLSIEVKSKLSKQEVKKSLKAAASLKELKPFRKSLIKGERGNEPEPNECRYFHCLFAYETDISVEEWLTSEFQRLERVATEEGLLSFDIDRIYVLNRGLIMPQEKRGIVENPEIGTALMYFYMHALNFLGRENRRRNAVPYLDYAGRMSHGWQHL